MSFYTKWADSSAEVVLGSAACVESTWSAGMGGTKPELWASTKPCVYMTLKQIKSDAVQQRYCTPLCDWLTVAALVFLCNKWESHGIL